MPPDCNTRLHLVLVAAIFLGNDLAGFLLSNLFHRVPLIWERALRSSYEGSQWRLRRHLSVGFPSLFTIEHMKKYE
jgi:hypothetical protein